MDMSHTGYFYFFLQLATQHFVAVDGFKTGVLHVKSFLQLVSQQKVARKIASCNMAFNWFIFAAVYSDSLVSIRGTQQTVSVIICSADLLSPTIFGLKCDEKVESSLAQIFVILI